jgi:hypothetical protein
MSIKAIQMYSLCYDDWSNISQYLTVYDIIRTLLPVCKGMVILLIGRNLEQALRINSCGSATRLWESIRSNYIDGVIEYDNPDLYCPNMFLVACKLGHLNMIDHTIRFKPDDISVREWLEDDGFLAYIMKIIPNVEILAHIMKHIANQFELDAELIMEQSECKYGYNYKMCDNYSKCLSILDKYKVNIDYDALLTLATCYGHEELRLLCAGGTIYEGYGTNGNIEEYNLKLSMGMDNICKEMLANIPGKLI